MRSHYIKSQLEERKSKSREITILRCIKLKKKRQASIKIFVENFSEICGHIFLRKYSLLCRRDSWDFSLHTWDSQNMIQSNFIKDEFSFSYWPIKAVLHLSHFFYTSFLYSFDWLSGLELPVKEVIEYDHHKSHEVVWLKRNTNSHIKHIKVNPDTNTKGQMPVNRPTICRER